MDAMNLLQAQEKQPQLIEASGDDGDDQSELLEEPANNVAEVFNEQFFQ